MSNHESATSDLGLGEKKLSIYIAGTITCIFLTLLPFAAVMFRGVFEETAVGIIVTCALAQFIIQLVCFLRLNYHTEQARLNVQSFALCLFILFVILVGSLWIMDNLHHNMMH